MTGRTARRSPRTRLDAELVRRGLARSREQAAELIAAGRVVVSGEAAMKAATQVTRDAPITIAGDDQDPGYVSRGGHKLAGALAAFPDLAVAGRHGLDAGASTGGFTDVLLRAGAAHVTAADVGYGQLAWSLRTDPRVTVLDRVNVRSLRPEQVAGPDGRLPDLVVADLSFISLALVLPALVGALTRTRISSCWSSLSSKWGRAGLARAGSCAMLDCGPKRSPPSGRPPPAWAWGCAASRPARCRDRPATSSTSSGCVAELRRWTTRTCGAPSPKAPSEASSAAAR